MSTYSLTNTNIDIISETIDEFLDSAKVDRKDALRIKFATDEILLNYQEYFGEVQEVTLECHKRFGRPRVLISIACDRFNPFDEKLKQGESSEVLNGVLVNMGLAPNWEYVTGENRITFVPRKKPPSQMEQLLVSIGSAIAIGGACTFLPSDIRAAIATYGINPIFDTFMGMLSAIAGPLIFFSIAWGIYSIGDTSTFSTVGKKMMFRFVVMSFLVTVIGCIPILPFFNIVLDGATSFNLFDLYKLILGMVPNNFIAPFVTGNPLHIIFVSIVIGLSMLILGNKTTIAAKLVEQSNYMVNLIMETISKFVPYFIFLSIFGMVIGDNFELLVQGSKILLVTLLAYTIAVAFYVGLVSFRRKVSPFILLKKLSQTFFIAVTTASSSAAFASNMETCERKLGIDKRIVNFGVPLGQIIYMIGGCILFMTAALCMAEVYGVNISPIWLVTALFISVILAIATPPIPGGSLTCYTLLFLQLNIPAEAIPIIIAVEVIMDFICTAVNLLCLQTELVELAGELDMLDYTKLRKAMK